MNLLALAKKILATRYLCDHCLGRQFAQLLSGYSNAERGKTVRMMLAMEYETQHFKIKPENFYGFKFRSSKLKATKPKKCEVCEDVFKKLDKFADKVIKVIPKNTRTFMIGTRLSKLTDNEENMWSKIGIQYCEPIRSEMNRELGKLVWQKTKIEPDEDTPEITAIMDMDQNIVEIIVASLFVSGGYKKLKRGLPQTKWEMYKETVEDIVAKPFMRATKGMSHSLHAAGREDIDALCLDWRPFVLEIKKPQKRDVDLKKLAAVVNKNKKVRVNSLKFSNRKEVVRVKSLRNDKEYRALVEIASPVTDKDLKKLSQLQTSIKQKTPERVVHRRADKTRKRRVKGLKWKRINNKNLELIIKGEAGLYIKEFISGDKGRTKPSVSELLKTDAKVKELDVIKIYK